MQNMKKVKILLWINYAVFLYLSLGCITGVLDVTVPLILPLGKSSLFEDLILGVLIESVLIFQALTAFHGLLQKDRISRSMYIHFLYCAFFPVCIYILLYWNNAFLLINMDLYTMSGMHFSMWWIQCIGVIFCVLCMFDGMYGLICLKKILKCPSCGTVIKYANGRYCPECGTPLEK